MIKGGSSRPQHRGIAPTELALHHLLLHAQDLLLLFVLDLLADGGLVLPEPLDDGWRYDEMSAA